MVVSNRSLREQVYELVLRRFLATLAPDASWKTLKILFVAGGEDG